ncbi:Ig-like domain-containing protein, partial [Streptococcus suis]|nr:Ig-like domain-containing protein [Streptococcus suis]
TVSSEEQTFSSVTDMTPVTLENDARSTINVSNLPDGVRYDEGTKTISGRPTNGVGDYTITVTASMPYALGGEVVTKTVKLHVTAVAPSIDATNDHQTVTAKDAITTIQVSKDAYSTMAEPYVLLNDGRQVSLSEIGLRYDNDAKTITGTPTVVGTHTIKLSTELERKLGGGTANKDVTLVVNEIPMSLDIANQEQTKIVMSAIDPVILTVPADTTITVDEGSLPPGVRYNADTKTFEGTPTRIGTYNVTVTVAPTGVRNNDLTKTVTFHVTALPASIDISNNNQTIQLGTEMTASVVTPNQYGELRGLDAILESVGNNSSGITERMIAQYLLGQYGLVYDTNTHTISGTPTKTGQIRFTFKSVNSFELGSNTAEETFVLTIVNDQSRIPVITAAVEGTTTITGTGVDGATITVTLPDGTEKTAQVVDGVWSVTSDKPLVKGQNISARQQENHKSVSDNISGSVAVADSLSPSALPVVNPVIEGTTTITGTGVDGATITVTLPDGTEKTAQVVDGVWSVTSDKPLVKGQNISARQQENHKSVSDNISGSVAVADSLSPSALPVVNPVIEGTTTITGTGVDGATITVTLPDGSVKTALVVDGTWTIENVPAFTKGQNVIVTQTESGKAPSATITGTAVPQITKGDNGVGTVVETESTTDPNGSGRTGTLVKIYSINEQGVKSDQPISTAFIPDGRDGQAGQDGQNGLDGKSVS